MRIFNKSFFQLFSLMVVLLAGPLVLQKVIASGVSTEGKMAQKEVVINNHMKSKLTMNDSNEADKVFNKPDETTLKAQLSPLQFEVTQREGTERPFKNEYWDNHAEGIYVDIVSGEPLFSSTDKFDSGTGWPSFTKPISDKALTEKEDRKLFMKRVEVRSSKADSHLGHVFNDGPAPTGLRYCINSASLRFIPKEKLEELGYGRFASLF